MKALKQEMPDHVLESKIGRRLIYAEADADGAAPPSIFYVPRKKHCQTGSFISMPRN